MANKFYRFKSVTALMLFGFAAFACADVVRCDAGSGDVTYTDTACGDDVQTTQLLQRDKETVNNIIYKPPSKITQARSSNWANASIAPRKGKVDRESVRSAHLRMIATDGTQYQSQVRSKLRMTED